MSALPKIRVLDMTRVFAGPFCAQMLGDFGAEVVKIEQPGSGDDVRRMGFRKAGEDGAPVGETSSFLAMNRNKRSIALDIAKPEGAALLRAMAAQADVFIENFKTGGLRKYGLDFASLAEVNPRLVYCSITGFGQSGPYAALPGYDPIFQAMSGLMSVTGVAEGEAGAGPAVVGYSVSDINAGLYATIAILAALHHRDTVSGRGQHIDLALLDAQVAAHAHIAMNHLVSGRMPVRAGTASQINTPWQAFSTADRPLMVAVGNDRQFAQLCQVLGIAPDPRFATNPQRMANRDVLLPLLQAAFLQRGARAWMDALNAVGVSSGPINDFGAVAEDPQIHHRGLFTELPDGTPTIANPVRFSETPVRYERPPPALAAHTAEVLSEWLGTDAAELARLAEAGVVA
ncbi:CaiB/BaiF CoA transferase family protein [Falsiroseomonas selenitidurans]|uniref:CoA transferase n=1 Tax=Falsiroseomonas selenitidurans TaxID=2716335 RepID=A0ABX1EEP9_9PROT|nr:CaiB/BaiF CoA-transferase family protein [Falsiroseomonas selenitidurans]NKC34012.1 CoA transferase [Falsiroseomonas selenitidurans]